MRVAASWPFEFVRVTTEPVETDQDIVTRRSLGKPCPVTATSVPGGPSRGSSSNAGTRAW